MALARARASAEADPVESGQPHSSSQAKGKEGLSMCHEWPADAVHGADPAGLRDLARGCGEQGLMHLRVLEHHKFCPPGALRTDGQRDGMEKTHHVKGKKW